MCEHDPVEDLEIDELLEQSSFGPTLDARNRVPQEVADELNRLVWEELGHPGEGR